MAEDEESAELDKKLQVKVYEDLGQGTVQKIGIMLGEVFDASTSWWLYPLRTYNARKRMIYEKNLKLLGERIDKIDQDNIVEIPIEISDPVMHRLTYTSNQDLADLFIELLAKAADEKTASTVHPAFVEIINRMSPDEARIVNFIRSRQVFAYVNINVELSRDIGGGQTQLATHLTGIEKYADIQTKDNMNVYLDNLTNLGLLAVSESKVLTDEKRYDNLKNLYADFFDMYVIDFSHSTKHGKVLWERGYYRVTDFGQLFMKVCTPPIIS